ncbi:MAG: biotin--[acetyl-CoA-carboxylase] ligase [Gammaproteobacteria bacterium]|nr:biotin--[acetyl-CoA-carboxylase] ligase [Gammaproteobacteria bacterium]MCY4342472.1 biotin--[acetyl-CoA-carboxylase] ligase [Gammaproteobacteria bacterium]
MSEELSVLLRRLLDHGEVPAHQFESEEAAPQRLGLVVRNGKVLLPAGVAALDPEAISALLAPQAVHWLRGVTVFPTVDSTNSRMVKLAQSASIDGLAWFAELQTAGRGRRGRHWLTPFGRNIALSLGFELGLPAGGLGGLSLAVGLAVAEFLRHEGVVAAAVKWPNDVYIGGAKVCGILMEVVAKAERCACIVGIGLNVDLPVAARTAIDREVTDLRTHGLSMDRNEIAAALASGVVEAVRRFGREGFSPRRSAYDRLHVCQGRECRMIQGDQILDGLVLGVTGEGALRMRCAGETIEVTGGEVSLRVASKPR